MRTLWTNRLLLKELIRRELKSKYIGSAGGRFWLMARPVAYILVYLFVFDVVFAIRMGGSRPGFAYFLLSGMLPWIALNESVNTGSASIVQSGAILKKTNLPFELFPAKAVASVALVYLPFVTLYAWGMMAGRFTFDWALLTPVWMLLQLALSYYLALNLAILTAAMRDVTQIVSIVTSVWMFLAPVIYPLERVPESVVWLLWLNPGTPLATGYHSLILDGSLPHWSSFLGILVWLFLLALLARRLLFRTRDQLVDWL